MGVTIKLPDREKQLRNCSPVQSPPVGSTRQHKQGCCFSDACLLQRGRAGHLCCSGVVVLCLSLEPELALQQNDQAI